MRVNNSEFLIKSSEIPKQPIQFSLDARSWWAEQKKRCLEGYTVGGKWMPPNLYFYVNFWNIYLATGKNDKVKRLGRPWLRDIEWDIFTAWSLARGLSGFENIEIPQDLSTEDKIKWLWNIPHENPGKPRYENPAKDLIILGPREFGKELKNTEPVITPDGEKEIGSIKVGNKIYGRDGKLANVVGVYPQGEKDIYELKLLDGRTSLCGKDHLWGVYKNGEYKVVSTGDMISDGLYYEHSRSGKSYKYYIPEIEEVDFPEKILPIHPYILGALLGDGSLNHATPRIASDDIEIINKFESLLEGYKLTKDPTNNNYSISYIVSKLRRKNTNPLSKEIRKLNLYVRCDEKFIPDIYKYSSIEQRYELVRGLLDTDGSINKEWGGIEFTNKSKKLTEDLAYVLRSLGIRCQISIDSREGREYINPQGKKSIFNRYYRLHIRTDKSVFYLSRKLNNIKERKRTTSVAIKSIEYLGKFPATCIRVDNEDHLFLTKDFIPTHNSELVAGGIMAHEWLFNGMKECFPPGTNEAKFTSEITVGAAATTYSNNLFRKFKIGYDALAEDTIEFGGKIYPHPFFQASTGIPVPGKTMTAQYNKKIGGEWKTFGSKSIIRHVAYKDAPFAAQGTRNNVMVKEEVGMFPNLLQTQMHDLETMKLGGRKYGSCVYIGTGGEMKEGTLGVHAMFYKPDTYDILPFNDLWENKGRIGMFIRGTKRFNDLRNSEGVVNEEQAEKVILETRQELKAKAASKQKILQDIQYNPLVPSEIFLRTTGNIFPIADLGQILAEEEIHPTYKYRVKLYEGKDGKITYVPDSNIEPVDDYPIEKGADGCDGAVVLWEPPRYDHPSEIPFERFIASLDPYSQDKAMESVSLGSCYIMDTWTDKIVAEYTGRPLTANIYYDNVRKLLKLYNARVLYENMFKSTHDFFEYKQELHLLVPTPEDLLRDLIPNSRVARGYGIHMNDRIREFGEQQALQWLIESTNNPDEPERANMHNIKSVGLLKELIYYNGGESNTDRADSFLLLIIYLRQIAKRRDASFHEDYIPIHKRDFFNRPMFQGRGHFLPR